MTQVDWPSISAKLKEPFNPDSVSWRVQGGKGEGGKSQVCAYLDSRDIQDRLDAVVGPENWSFDWQPIVTDAKGLLVAKGTLTIYGVSKSDVGDASTFEGTKGTVSDCLKRSAVQWGIGRYLYDLPAVYVTMHGAKPADSEKSRLRAILTGEKLPEQRQPTQAQPQKPVAAPAKPTPPSAPAQKPAQPASVTDLRTELGKLAKEIGYDRDGFNDLLAQHTFDGKVQLHSVKEQLERERATHKAIAS